MGASSWPPLENRQEQDRHDYGQVQDLAGHNRYGTSAFVDLAAAACQAPRQNLSLRATAKSETKRRFPL